MATTSHLRSLQAVELAIRTGSLKAAADEIGITPAALGQRIKTLEDFLGFDLLVRGRSGIRPTRELAAAMAHLAAGFRELETVTRILDFQRVHEIHIVSDTDWAELWLKPRLSRFKSAHPNIGFCVNGTGDVPIRLGQSDCEIRLGEFRDASEEVELFNDYLLPVASPANARRIAELPAEHPLEGFPLLHLDCYTQGPDAFGWPEWVRNFGLRTTSPGRGIRYRQVVNALEAVYSDAGLVICGLALIGPQLESGDLSQPFPVEKGRRSSQAYIAHFRQDALRRTQVQAFRNWLMDEAGQTRKFLDDVAPGTADVAT